MDSAAPVSPPFFNDESNEPGVHALIIGVSAYSHLHGGTNQPDKEPLLGLSRRLAQLAGPAQSAIDLANFLIDRKAKLAKPLRTLRLLASPSDTEAGRSFDGIAPATAELVAKALGDWQMDNRRSEDEVGFFYFGGHGAQISRTNAILL
jgi:hypothetical protein